MNDRPAATGPGPDDEAIGLLVRDLAEDWSMPPHRLGQPTWRDRVDALPRRRRIAASRAGRLLRHLGAAATVAIAATLGLALVAVVLTAPRSSSIGKPSPSVAQGQASAPAASPSGSVGPTTVPPSAPAASAIPAYALFGPKLSGRVVAQFGASFGAIDLADGSRGGDLFPGTTWGTQVFRLPGGGLLCICQRLASTNYIDGTLTVDIRTLAADGTLTSRFGVTSLAGDADPGRAAVDDGQGVVASADLSADGRTAYVGWVYRKSPVWHLGIDVVDIQRRAVVQTVRLPDRPSLVGDVAADVWIGPIRVAPDGSAVMMVVGDSVAQNAAAHATYNLASLASGRITSVKALPKGTASVGNDGCAYSASEGWATASTYYVVCGVSPSTYVLFDRSGSTIATTPLSGAGPSIETVAGGSDVVDASAGLLYHWDPIGRTLTRLDLASGTVTGTTTAAPTSDAGEPGLADRLGDFGAAIGRWLAPIATAKTILQPGLALSPDGTRIYALGVLPPVNFISGSTGIDVFDTGTMRQVDHWTPPADLVSIAVSPDGRQVYVAGAAETNANGGHTDDPGSLFVYDAPGGRLHVIVGDLGRDDVALVP